MTMARETMLIARKNKLYQRAHGSRLLKQGNNKYVFSEGHRIIKDNLITWTTILIRKLAYHQRGHTVYTNKEK